MVDPTAPAIPAWLAHRPCVGGVVVPWITPRASGGRYLFGVVDKTLVERALRQRRCGVCGRQLDDRLVLMMRLSDLPHQGSAEPGLHPICAHYTTSACPMINGRLSTYRSSPIPLDTGAPCDPASQPSVEQAARQGARAEPWFAVWLSDYHLAEIAGHLAASYAGTRPLRIRPVTWRSLPLW